jgi:hypothetical protein
MNEKKVSPTCIVATPEEEREFERIENQQPKQNTYGRPLTNRMKANGTFDAYDIGTAYELNPMLWAAVKKIIGNGTRNGGKSSKQDIDEAIESLQQYQEEFSNG